MAPPIPLETLPTLNACINGVTACLITTGFVMIKKGHEGAHRKCMTAAVLLSVVFLASYLTYHWQMGVTRYPGVGTMRIVYFSILTSHTILAAVTLPLVIVTVTLAALGKFEKHKKLAKYTYPAWLYISVTGVMIYLMLYHLPGGVGS